VSITTNTKVPETSKENKTRRPTTLIVLVVVLVLLVAFGFWFFGQIYNKKNSDKETSTQKNSDEGCGPLIVEDGKVTGLAPFSPVVKAKIVGSFAKDKEVCHWTVNGQDYGTSKPYGDYCIRYGLTFRNVGDYKISYKVDGLKNCPQEITLKVTGLTEAQKASDLEIKRSGVQPEDLQ